MKTEILIEFIKDKMNDAEETLKRREEMQKVWAGGTNKSWREIGCRMSQVRRLETSAIHGRIALKQRTELELFRAVLENLKSQ